VTNAGQARLRTATKLWAIAQSRFEAVFGAPQASALRAALREVSVKEYLV
jgi:hypothetical protein